jgi:hypothetical protein
VEAIANIPLTSFRCGISELGKKNTLSGVEGYCLRVLQLPQRFSFLAIDA